MSDRDTQREQRRQRHAGATMQRLAELLGQVEGLGDRERKALLADVGSLMSLGVQVGPGVPADGFAPLDESDVYVAAAMRGDVVPAPAAGRPRGHEAPRRVVGTMPAGASLEGARAIAAAYCAGQGVGA